MHCWIWAKRVQASGCLGGLGGGCSRARVGIYASSSVQNLMLRRCDGVGQSCRVYHPRVAINGKWWNNHFCWVDWGCFNPVSRTKYSMLGTGACHGIQWFSARAELPPGQSGEVADGMIFSRGWWLGSLYLCETTNLHPRRRTARVRARTPYSPARLDGGSA